MQTLRRDTIVYSLIHSLVDYRITAVSWAVCFRRRRLVSKMFEYRNNYCRRYIFDNCTLQLYCGYGNGNGGARDSRFDVTNYKL